MSSLPLHAYLQGEVDTLRESGLLKELRLIDGKQSTHVRVGDREFVMMSSNNYLGLASNPLVREAVSQALVESGVGAVASRTITGTMRCHAHCEERLREYKETESALVFSTGYMANIGVITALARNGDLILSDELNHASIIDGCRLSKATTRVFKHRSTSDLLANLVDRRSFRNVFIITDGVFSMDGDVAPLAAYVRIAKDNAAYVIVDDAHGVGALGKGGRGTPHELGVHENVDVVVGTLGKAIGCFGAYVTGPTVLKQYLISTSRAFIFTTAPPPAILAGVVASIDILEKHGEDMRIQLWRNVDYYRAGLSEIGVEVLDSTTHIVPILTGSTEVTMDVAERLQHAGVLAHGVRPPAVPDGLGRLRTTVMSVHSREDLDRVLNALDDVRDTLRAVRERYRGTH